MPSYPLLFHVGTHVCGPGAFHVMDHGGGFNGAGTLLPEAPKSCAFRSKRSMDLAYHCAFHVHDNAQVCVQKCNCIKTNHGHEIRPCRPAVETITTQANLIRRCTCTQLPRPGRRLVPNHRLEYISGAPDANGMGDLNQLCVQFCIKYRWNTQPHSRVNEFTK